MKTQTTVNILLCIIIAIGAISVIFNIKYRNNSKELYDSYMTLQRKCQPYIEYKRVKDSTVQARNYANYLERIRANKHDKLFKSLNN